MPEVPDSIEIEVVYAEPARAWQFRVRVPVACAVGEAVSRSGLLQAVPELDPAALSLGIYGRRVAADQPLAAGDRIEIYRPLTADPKQARRRRVRR